MKHILIKDPALKGWEYGMLRAFELAIVEFTGATVLTLPKTNQVIAKSMGQGMRLGKYRGLLPKKTLVADSEVIWSILMGPENYRLDLFKDWESRARFRVVYLFDTMEAHLPLIKKLFTGNAFTHLFTSFSDAIPLLERSTNRKWYTAAQAVPESLFYPVSFEEKIIHFSSYGRRQDRFHRILSGFCRSKGLIYDYTTHGMDKPVASEDELYRQYAWHIRHSLFTVSWPVETTHPQRAGSLSPITCRWFEAASAATSILGHQPANPDFERDLAPGLVINLDLDHDEGTIVKQLNDLWENRKSHYDRSLNIALANTGKWTWHSRVKEILGELRKEE